MTAGTTPTGAPAVVAVDLGGSAMKGIVMSGSGHELASRTVPTPEQDVVPALVQLLRELSHLATEAGAAPVGVGVVTPGSVDETSNTRPVSGS